MTLVDVTCRAFLGFGVVAGVAGCGGGSNATPASPTATTGGTTTPVTTPVSTAAASVYVIQDPTAYGAGTGSVLQFPAASTGSVSPTAMITAPTNTSFNSLAVDGTGNLYVTYNGALTSQGGLVEYAAGATASSTPIRTLPETAVTGVTAVDGIAVSAGGEIFVAEDYGAVQAFSATATGNVAPTRRITGASETGGGLSTVIVADAVAADTADNLYVVNQGGPGLMPIVVFGPTATGNVAPTRTLGGALTTISGVSGLTTDSAGNLYLACTTSTFAGAKVTYAGSILVFGPGATGDVAPIRTITGSATLLTKLAGIKVDAVGNIYVVTSIPMVMASSTLSVLKFSATANGNVAPASSFSSSAWTTADNGGSIAIY